MKSKVNQFNFFLKAEQYLKKTKPNQNNIFLSNFTNFISLTGFSFTPTRPTELGWQ